MSDGLHVHVRFSLLTENPKPTDTHKRSSNISNHETTDKSKKDRKSSALISNLQSEAHKNEDMSISHSNHIVQNKERTQSNEKVTNNRGSLNIPSRRRCQTASNIKMLIPNPIRGDGLLLRLISLTEICH